MGCKDLQVLLLLSWLFSGYALEVWAVGESGAVLGDAPPPKDIIPTIESFRDWDLSGRDTKKLLQSRDGNFSLNLMFSNESKHTCVLTVQHSSNVTVWASSFNDDVSSPSLPSGNQSVTCVLKFERNSGLSLSFFNTTTEIWRTPNLDSNFNHLRLNDSGCLLIYSNETDGNSSVWKSFDHATDTLIVGQRLLVNQSLYASQLNRRYSSGGIFSMQIHPAEVALFQNFTMNDTRNRNMSIRYGSFPSRSSIQHVEMMTTGPHVFTDMNSSFPLVNIHSGWDYVTLGPDGGLVLKTYTNKELKVQHSVNAPFCSLPGKCGAYGICFSGNSSCGCPGGFTQAKLRGDFFTCQRVESLNATRCIRGESVDKFVKVTGQTALHVSEDPQVTHVNATVCESNCMNDCNCSMALHVRRNASDPTLALGVCFVNLGDSLQTIWTDGGNNLQTLFLRIIQGSDALPSPAPAPAPGPPTKNPRKKVAVGFAVGFGALMLLLLAGSVWWLHGSRRKLLDEADKGNFDGDAVGVSSSQLPPQYSYKELAESTSNFAQTLGYGATFSSVYAGHLPDNTKIAVKKLDDNGLKGSKEFSAAVATAGRISHPSLVPLWGFCKEGKHRMLVYELVNEGRSLNWYLFHERPPLNASTRRSIALGAARGLAHLHEDCDSGGVIHGGVKPENILIDRKMQPRLVDYGFVGLMTKDRKLHAASVRGARGYMAPEWAKFAPITKKVDVYSLGVVILELVSGRRCVKQGASQEQAFLPSWAFSLLRRGNGDPNYVLELVDPSLDVRSLSEIDQAVLKGMIFVALWCVQEDPSLRPPMKDVVKMLEGDLAVETPPLSPALDAFGKDLCARRAGERSPESSFMHSPSLSENSEMRPR